MNIAKIIDHTELKPDATINQILQLIEDAKINKFASVCVNPKWAKLASIGLKDSEFDKTCLNP